MDRVNDPTIILNYSISHDNVRLQGRLVLPFYRKKSLLTEGSRCFHLFRLLVNNRYCQTKAKSFIKIHLFTEPKRLL